MGTEPRKPSPITFHVSRFTFHAPHVLAPTQVRILHPRRAELLRDGLLLLLFLLLHADDVWLWQHDQPRARRTERGGLCGHGLAGRELCAALRLFHRA